MKSGWSGPETGCGPPRPSWTWSSGPIAPRSRTRTRATGTGPMPVWIARSGACPYRTSRASIRQPQVLHRAQEGVRLQLDGLGKQAARPGAQHLLQGIVDILGLTKPDDVGRCLHGVSLLPRGSGRLRHPPDTPPSTHRRHPISRISRHHLVGNQGSLGFWLVLAIRIYPATADDHPARYTIRDTTSFIREHTAR